MKTIISFFRSPTFLSAFRGAFLLWLAFPPVDWWPLAWVAPVPWVLLIRREKLEGPRPYLAVWLAGLAFWLAALHWLRLPHPLTSIGWIALAFYFAFYILVFLGLSRAAVHRLCVPVILAAPIVWTGLELVRGHLLSGMTMASLGHTQYRWVPLIQISDLTGAYGVSFLVMFVAACLSRMIPLDGKRRAFWPLAPAGLSVLVVWGYGDVRITGREIIHDPSFSGAPSIHVALIQGSIDTIFGQNGPEDREKIFSQYLGLSKQAVARSPRPDLVVWPETYFLYPLITMDPDACQRSPEVAAARITPEQARRNLAENIAQTQRAFRAVTAELNTPILVGLDALHYTAEGVRIYNTAAYVTREGELIGRYDKMHPVMFGEYIPLADRIAWLNYVTPLSMGLTPGKKPQSFDLKNLRFAPNICFESVLPHLIRRQVLALRAEGREPDFLVNLTNDGWFWGSSELDLHLACGVFRAVECRKPFLIAANTGFSALIDGDGRILAQGPRRATAILLAEVRRDPRHSWYLNHGDYFAGACLLTSVLFVLGGMVKGRKNRMSNRG
jgi:apolipoprotein N-acyltransferase